ncbi:MAG: hypothetical protein ACRD0B_04240 [Acidimicrobiales bacterium]
MRVAWFSRRSLALHATVLVVSPGCLAAGWWMLDRAVHGDPVAWIYSVEWPFFAGYGIWMWWRLLHDDPSARRAAMAGATSAARIRAALFAGAALPPVAAGTESAVAGTESAVAGTDGDDPSGVGLAAGEFDPYDDADPELAAYNRYLADLHEHDRARRS